MEGTTLREELQGVLSPVDIMKKARRLDVVERRRAVCVVSLVIALVLTGGEDERRGRLSSVYEEYLAMESVDVVGRSGFNARFDEGLSALMVWLLWEVLERAKAQPVLLRGILSDVSGGLEDWLIVDSETVRLRKELAEVYDNGQGGAALKVHKVYSLGRLTLLQYRISDAREHDNKHFRVTPDMAGHGLLVDLGYASMQLLCDCARYSVRYVIRLKSSWKPKVCGRLFSDDYEQLEDPVPFQMLLECGGIELDGSHIDVDVLCGAEQLPTRLVGVPTPDGDYRFYLTNLPRNSHSPSDCADIYRCRWDIEHDNKVDKTASRLDHLCHARSKHSLHTLICASLLHSVIAGSLAHAHRLERLKHEERWGKRPPLHKIALALAIASLSDLLHRAILSPDTVHWGRIAHKLERLAHDKNWRSRPSVLDSILQDTAPPGRPRCSTLAESPPDAEPLFFRENAWNALC